MQKENNQQHNVQITQPDTIELVQWAPQPTPIPGVLPGLEYLSQSDTLNVKQEVNLLEAFSGFEKNNKYSIMNAQGQKLYYVFEKTDTLMRLCCGTSRAFTLHIVDKTNRDVFRISRDIKYCAGCCCCNYCAHEVVIETPTGTVLGYVRQIGSFYKSAYYHIMDESRTTLYKIWGPCFKCDIPCFPCSKEFIINDIQTGKAVGAITKEHSGFIKEMFTTADNFTINFPVVTPPNIKACILGAVFLIDMVFFEESNNYIKKICCKISC